MTETIRTVMALHGLYPDSISNSLRVQDVYGDSRSYCVRCGRTWTSHVTWIKLDLRSQRVLKNWKQPCLDCGQEVSPYITSEELERMVTIAVERCLELIEEQKKADSPGSPSSESLERRRSSAEKLKENEQGRSSPPSSTGEPPSPPRKLDIASEPTVRHTQATAFRHNRPRPPPMYRSYPIANIPNQINMQSPQMPIYTTGLVPVHVYYGDGSWAGQLPPYASPTPVTYIQPGLASPEMPQQLPWSPPMTVVCP